MMPLIIEGEEYEGNGQWRNKGDESPLDGG
jgi:hypothetical protein